MAIEEQGSVAKSKEPGEQERKPRRRWRTLQNRIERARELRHAAAAVLLRARRPAGGGTPAA
jgi:hypothetical protein